MNVTTAPLINTNPTAAVTSQSAVAHRISLGVKEVAQILGICSRGVYRLLNETDFPKPRKIGRLSRWDLTEVLDWWNARAAS